LRFAALVLLLIATARAAAGQDSTAARPVRITYLTTTSAYVDAGREEGLKEGDSLRVVRAGSAVGLLRVAFLASRQASCDILSDPAALVVGDTLDIARAAVPPVVAVGGKAPAETSARPSRRAAETRAGRRRAGRWRRAGAR